MTAKLRAKSKVQAAGDATAFDLASVILDIVRALTPPESWDAEKWAQAHERLTLALKAFRAAK